MPFGWCLCALFIELSSLHLWKCVVIGQDYPPRAAYVTIIGVLGGCQLNTRVARTVDCVPPQLQPESSSVVTGKKESSDMLSYQEG